MKTDNGLVQEIMCDYASLTGLEPINIPPKRYLWTDAFAVCNYLQLFRQTNDETYRDLALHLVDQVHHTLGFHRDDDPRKGWISGLNEHEGELHPTKGGLRIGKQLNERKPNEPPDERLEWDQDGQYYHYLTKWMHALNCVSRAVGDPVYTKWAIELAKAAHAAFTYMPSLGRNKRMYWKMSIDLSYPLVSAMGQHDPLDGFITYNELQTSAAEYCKQLSYPDLNFEISDMAGICKGMNLATSDPLGTGGLLFDALRTVQLMIAGSFKNGDLLESILGSALFGVKSFENSNYMEFPAEYRLAFRELGLSIGLKGMEILKELFENNKSLFRENISLGSRIEALEKYLPIGERIEQFWMDSKNRKSQSWIDHREINMVMFATSISPKEFLTI